MGVRDWFETDVLSEPLAHGWSNKAKRSDSRILKVRNCHALHSFKVVCCHSNKIHYYLGISGNTKTLWMEGRPSRWCCLTVQGYLCAWAQPREEIGRCILPVKIR